MATPDGDWPWGVPHDERPGYKKRKKMDKRLLGAAIALGTGVLAYFLFFRRDNGATGYLPPGGAPSPRRGGGARAPVETSVPQSDPGGTALTRPIFFRHARTSVPDVYAPLLQRTVQWMATKIQSVPSIVFVIVGYASATSTVSTDTAISQERAEAVYQYLVGAGVPPSNLHFVGGGPTSEFGDNATDAGQAENRRVMVGVQELSRSAVS